MGFSAKKREIIAEFRRELRENPTANLRYLPFEGWTFLDFLLKEAFSIS
jgi:hypothetical protein